MPGYASIEWYLNKIAGLLEGVIAMPGNASAEYSLNRIYEILQNGISSGLIISGSATDGQVLTADGSGGSAWEDVPAGGGSSYFTSTVGADWYDFGNNPQYDVIFNDLFTTVAGIPSPITLVIDLMINIIIWNNITSTYVRSYWSGESHEYSGDINIFDYPVGSSINFLISLEKAV